VIDGETMGTTYTVALVGALDEGDRQRLASSIQSVLDEVNERMSNYLVDSELSRLNRAPVGEAFAVSKELAFVLSEAQRISELTSGAFDVTVSPLVRLWGFGPGPGSLEADDEPSPAETAIAAARERVGFRALHLSETPPVATKEKALELDLSAIAKGYAVDRVALFLADEGYDDYLVEIGGELRSSGMSPRGDAWRVAIEKPLPGVRAVARVVPLRDLALATSGDYRNFYERDGRLWSHLIDPAAGRPVSHTLGSVSVAHESCMTADALASGLLVMGPEDGYRLALREGWAALFLSRSPDHPSKVTERATPAFEREFGVLGTPTSGERESLH
jgi:thiamine biosynthesis lipoprotein